MLDEKSSETADKIEQKRSIQQQSQNPIVKADVLREDEDKHELRCGVCGRHIATLITKHAVVSATCARKNCKKLNKFYIQGSKTENEVLEKSNKATY